MKLWIDDIRPAPNLETYFSVVSVDQAKMIIEFGERSGFPVDLIDIDHDAGEYAQYGGDYIEILNWLEETGRSYPIRIHSMNPVGRGNMRRIIRKNGWTEID